MTLSPFRALALAAVGLASTVAAAPAATAAPGTADAPGAAADVHPAVTRMIEAYGGDALRTCEGFRARGRVLSLLDGVSGRLKLVLQVDGSFRSEIRYPGRQETRVLSGRLAWNGGGYHQKPSTGEMADSMRLQFHRMAAPFEIARADPADLEFLGESDEGWIRIRRAWTEELASIYEIDPESGRILRITGVMGPEGSELEFFSESHDFRTVDGVLFPFRVTTLVNDEPAAEIILERVTLESDFPAEDFRPDDLGGEM